MDTALPTWLIYCRPGFERDCVEETQAKPIEATENSGYVVLQGKPRLAYSQLAFARQLLRLHGEVNDLPERDRLTPLLAAIPDAPEKFSALYLEVPDTNEGKTLSGFTRRFQPLLEEALREQGRLRRNTQETPEKVIEADVVQGARNAATETYHEGRRGSEYRATQQSAAADTFAGVSSPRLHIFFPDQSRALIATSDPHNSSAALNGIQRVSMVSDAPSRSYLKLAEAFEVFLDKKEQALRLKPGMTAIDLGAAPGGWTWQLVQRGLKVTAVDNGPLKGAAAGHPSIKHLRQDGFRYRPQRPVDWLVCDMVEQPQRVAALVTEWFVGSLTQRAIFNLKLPMKKRVAALNDALNSIRTALNAKGIRYQLEAKQLYHDREEVTVYLARKR